MPKPVTAGPGAASSPGWALASLSLAMMLSSLGTSIANVALPTLAEAFTAPFPRVQWVVLAYLLATTTMVVGAGRLGDLVGRRRLLLAGIALFTMASAACGLAPGLGVLVAARAVQGLGAAVMMALAMALAGESVPAERTGRAMGLLGTMSAVGTALGPALGGALVSALGWRAIFLSGVPLGGLALLLASRHLPAERREAGADRPGFDGPGTGLLALALAAYALAMTAGGGRFGPGSAALLLGAAAGAGLFVLAETRSASPLVQVARLRDPVLGASLAASALVMTVMMATLVVGPFYLSRALGLGAAAVGIAMSAGPVVTALASAPAGRMADRFGAQRMTVLGLAGAAAGSLAIAVLPRSLGAAGYVAPLTVVTAGYALFQAANHTAVMRDVPREERGVHAGLLALSRNLGLITGASVMGAVFARAAATDDVATAAPEAVAAGMRATFLAASALAALAILLAAGRGPGARAGRA